MLEQSDLFCVLEPAQRDLLAEHLTAVYLQSGEILGRQGETPERYSSSHRDGSITTAAPKLNVLKQK